MNSQPFRTPAGWLVDRESPVTFTFDGRSYQGLRGDTLASALIANGVKLVGRSFKYHRPRGIYTAGSDEPNALVTLRDGDRAEPNTRATTVELFDGLVATSQNRWPSLRFDLMAATSLLAPLLPAGFYYKTFMWPGLKGWMFYERHIRRAAGLGVASGLPDPDRYEKCHAFCDVLVVGGGPAGLTAALAAGRGGARVILVDENPLLGGAMLAETPTADPDTPVAFAFDLAQEIAELANIRVMTRTTAFGLYDHNVVGLIERVEDHKPQPSPLLPRQRSWTVRTTSIVLATGAPERPVVFGNNDLPGVMLASAARRYVNQYGALPGTRAVFFTTNDSVYEAAIDLVEAGLYVAAIVDTRPEPPADLRAMTDRYGIHVVPGAAITRALGRGSVRAAEFATLLEDGRLAPKSDRRVDCDLLCVSGGWSPLVHLHSHLGQRPVYDEAQAAFLAPPDAGNRFSAGSVTGLGSTRDCLNSGIAAATAALKACRIAPAEMPTYENDGPEPDPLPQRAIFEVPAPGRTKKFVDIQDDVTAGDVRMAAREGYRSVELLKRYTTLGMGTDQGKTSNVNGLAILAAARGEPIPAVGTTVFRPPFVPVALGALAGAETGGHFRPTRLTPMHGWHQRRGATFIQAGQWLRPQYYTNPGETVFDAYTREAAHVRAKVGLVDVSTLGKIDIQGPDAGIFLDRVYVNGFSTLAVGRARYGVMLREDGFIFDDGTTSRIAEDRFFMTTTTANAAGVMAHLEYLLQVVWRDLRVDIASVTDQWAGMALAGPLSRDVLAAVIEGHGVDNDSLPFMGVVDAHLDGAPVRIHRISFSGELAYELYTPAGYGEAVWSRLIEAGAPHDIAPYGTEAMGALRIEKGHPAGPELTGRTTLGDLGLERLASKKKPFVGSVLRHRPGLVAADRQCLIGLKPLSPTSRLRSGALIVELDEDLMDDYAIGQVTSVTYSPVVGQHVALGLMRAGRSRIGSTVNIVYPLKDEEVVAEVTDPVFYDREGTRLHD